MNKLASPQNPFKEGRVLDNLKIWIVLVGLVIATIKDMKTGKITNSYNLGFGFVGIIYGFVMGGVKGVLVSLLGAVLPVALLIILFSKDVLGAGDIKLFSALGSFAGIEIIWILMYSFLLCGLYGLVLMLARLIGWIKKEGNKESIIYALTQGKQYTMVAFSIFILGGYICYLMKGGFFTWNIR